MDKGPCVLRLVAVAGRASQAVQFALHVHCIDDGGAGDGGEEGEGKAGGGEAEARFEPLFPGAAGDDAIGEDSLRVRRNSPGSCEGFSDGLFVYDLQFDSTKAEHGSEKCRLALEGVDGVSAEMFETLLLLVRRMDGGRLTVGDVADGVNSAACVEAEYTGGGDSSAFATPRRG